MKKIINGLKYDTDTAIEICSVKLGYRGDLSYCWTILYRTLRGSFFLYCEGGPMSRYASYEGSSEWRGSAKITPVSEEQAKGFTECYGSLRDYEATFGPVEEA